MEFFLPLRIRNHSRGPANHVQLYASMTTHHTTTILYLIHYCLDVLITTWCIAIFFPAINLECTSRKLSRVVNREWKWHWICSVPIHYMIDWIEDHKPILGEFVVGITAKQRSNQRQAAGKWLKAILLRMLRTTLQRSSKKTGAYIFSLQKLYNFSYVHINWIKCFCLRASRFVVVG